ncbi:MAG: class I mannose-6-phosphate isomerase [Chloroflexi bacterium]|nr:class I mannose-6-phosphate isomerase [Ardenticatenaceae bacterium]MBL1128557.1 mannose-6-phosphate isomerase [Chloroflexota bacterium]NOG34636.1 class I mannose-6-phosphate isomerase [Chloroflexota bacterium]
MSERVYPMTFAPVLKDYIWGGRRLEQLGRLLPPGNIAESWEIAAHEDGVTAVTNGRYAGKLLTEVQAELGLDLIGTNCAWAQARGKFPLLVKLLDANRALSVQVHPDDAYALAHEGNELGKTEMWVVLDAKPGAQVQLGVKAGTTPELFRQGIEEGNLEPYLHYVPVKPGDHICVPAGTLHAIMDGILIAEIQQNSNTTYRVYDWNRVGADGKARPLHIDKALDVINFDQVEPFLCPAEMAELNGLSRSLLCANQYFVTERVEMAAGAVFAGNCNGRSLEIWGVLSGEVVVNGVGLTAVQFVLLPAAMGKFMLTTTHPSTLLRTYVEVS